MGLGSAKRPRWSTTTTTITTFRVSPRPGRRRLGSPGRGRAVSAGRHGPCDYQIRLLAPGVRTMDALPLNRHRDPPPPAEPTRAHPGTEEKVDELAARLLRGEALW